MTDCQNQFLPALQKILGILLGLLQLAPIIVTAGYIPDNDNQKDYCHQDSHQPDTGNRTRSLAQDRLLVLHTGKRLFHLFLFYRPEHLIDTTRNHSIVIPQIAGPL